MRDDAPFPDRFLLFAGGRSGILHPRHRPVEEEAFSRENSLKKRRLGKELDSTPTSAAGLGQKKATKEV
jgi:hypothetical protein